MLTNIIMKFECKSCKYESNDKSNYARHLNSVKHNRNAVPIVHNYPDYPIRITPGYINNEEKQEDNKIQKKEYKCKDCNTIFSFASGLSRHKKDRCIKDKSDSIENIKEQLEKDFEKKLKAKEVEKEKEIEKALQTQKINFLEQQVKELKAYINSTKPGNNTNTTYNISVKNYIQQIYSDAPYLIKLDNYALLKNEEEEKEGIDDFADVLVHQYKHKRLHTYLGDFVIKQYKKEDPAEQSLWNSDVSRLTYIIKELLANKKSHWNHDFKGLKTKNYIIQPLLEYIQNYCIAYNEACDLDKDQIQNERYCHKITEKLNILGNIINDITKHTLSEEIVKYIAPHFQIPNKQDNFEFIDDDTDNDIAFIN